MAKRRFAIFDSDQECVDHSVAWSGRIPNTGTLRCALCGTEWLTRREYDLEIGGI